MFRDIPVFIQVLVVLFFVIAISSAVFTFQKCGAKALLLGNGATTAALLGMCDE